jgi:tetratricopeptide (TPR) repeat protein
MAVPRLQVLTPQQIAERLDERFRLLVSPGREAPPRQRSLRAMLDWSWELLLPAEQELLQRLAIFAAGARLGAIVALDGAKDDGEWNALDGLTALVEKSLVIAEIDGPEPRYRLLETTRHYALERLGACRVQRLRRQHAARLAELLERAEAEWPTTHSALWLERYGAEADDLRAALGWAFGADGDGALALRLTAYSYPLWWDLPGLPLREGRRWFDLAVARTDDTTPAPVAARIWLGHGWRDVRHGDGENYPAAARAAALFGEAGDRVGLGAALWRAGSTLMTYATALRAGILLGEAEEVLRREPPGKWLALVLIKRGDLLHRLDRPQAALAAFEEAMQLVRATGYWYGLMNGGSNMADLLFRLGERDRALEQLETLRGELAPGLRSPLVATLAAHLAIAGRAADARAAVREVVANAPATGLTSALAWAAETLALLTAESGDPCAAARLGAFASAVHAATIRAGAQREVRHRLDTLLATCLATDDRARLEAEGAAWREEDAIAAAARCP